MHPVSAKWSAGRQYLFGGGGCPVERGIQPVDFVNDELAGRRNFEKLERMHNDSHKLKVIYTS